MTKEEAIYLLRNTAWLAPSLEQVEEAVDMATEALKAGTEMSLPKWIPCSERLPETEISVLIWLPSHWNINGGTIEIGFLDEDNEWNWLAESMSGYYEIVEGVSAWMPLPDPWEGADDE